MEQATLAKFPGKVTSCSAVSEAFGNYTSGMYILSASLAVTE